MRRLKRDPLERAFLRGYQYGVGGKSRELLLYRRYAKPGLTAGEKDAATTGTV